jgi:hypothetical protein
MRTSSTHISTRVFSLLTGALALLALLGLSACSNVQNVQIDWANFVRFGGITYVATADRVGRLPTDADLGPVFATVHFRLNGNVHDPNYQTKDGDAAYLDAGTTVYTVQGYVPTFRLIALFAGRLTLYEADTNPHATIGADLLDIGGKVRYIGINSEQDDTTELGAVKDPAQVAALVAMVLAAHVDQSFQEHNSSTYFIAFHLDDGTAVTRAYWLSSGELARGILLPAPFGAAIQAALRT